MSSGFSNSIKVAIGVTSKVKHAIVNVRHTESRCTCASVGKLQRKREVTICFRCFPLQLSAWCTHVRRGFPFAMTQWIDLLGTILASLTPVEIMHNLICPFTFPQNYFPHLFSSLNTFLSPFSPAVWVPFFPFVLYHPIPLARSQSH